MPAAKLFGWLASSSTPSAVTPGLRIGSASSASRGSLPTPIIDASK